MKIIQFTHIDLDGIACEIVAKCYYNNIEVHRVDYDKIEYELRDTLSKLTEQALIIISDISYPKEATDITIELLSKHKVIIADHHASSVWLKDIFCHKHNVRIECDGHKCGAVLLHDILYTSTLQNKDISRVRLNEFLSNVTAWDTWTWVDNYKDPLESNIPYYYNTAHLCLGNEEFYNNVMAWLKNPLRTGPFTEVSVHDKVDKFIKEQTKHIDKVLSGYELYTISTKSYGDLTLMYLKDGKYQQSIISMLASKLPAYKDVDVIFIEQPSSISLRYGKDIDLSILAKELGNGGGHKVAARFSTDNFDWNQLKEYKPSSIKDDNNL